MLLLRNVAKAPMAAVATRQGTNLPGHVLPASVENKIGGSGLKGYLYQYI